MKQNEPLSRKQEKAIEALLTAPSLDKAAEEAGVSRTTLWRWHGQPAFKSELARRRNELVDAAMDELKGHVSEATKALVDLLKSPNDRVKLKASELLTVRILRFRELQDVEARLLKLEENTAGTKTHSV